MSRQGTRVLSLSRKPRGEVTGPCPALKDTCGPRQGIARATHLKENTLGIRHWDCTAEEPGFRQEVVRVRMTHTTYPQAGVDPWTPKAA